MQLVVTMVIVGKWVLWFGVTRSSLEQVSLFKLEIMQADKVTHFTSEKVLVMLLDYIETNEALAWVETRTW